MDGIKYKISLRGSVHIYDCVIIKESKDIVAFNVETDTEYGVIPYVGYDENQIPYIALDRDNSMVGDTTEVAFKEYIGFDFFSYHWSKKIIHICLIKKS